MGRALGSGRQNGQQSQNRDAATAGGAGGHSDQPALVGGLIILRALLSYWLQSSAGRLREGGMGRTCFKRDSAPAAQRFGAFSQRSFDRKSNRDLLGCGTSHETMRGHARELAAIRTPSPFVQNGCLNLGRESRSRYLEFDLTGSYRRQLCTNRHA